MSAQTIDNAGNVIAVTTHAQNTRVRITVGSTIAGDGRWTGTRIEDCPAILGADETESAAIYDRLDAMLIAEGH